MKKLYKLLIAVVCVIVAFASVGCNNVSDRSECAITVDLSAYSFDSETVTLLDYMGKMSAEGKLTYETSGSGDFIMITSINGMSQKGSSYWMLYTNDTTEGVASTEYGSYEYNGETLGMANFGAASLVVKDGCVYVWAYQAF